MIRKLHQPIHELYRDQARKSPEAIALIENQRRITFGELDTLSDNVASSLCVLDVRAGDMVGLHIDRSICWVVAAIGILKAGAAVVPLPPAFPAKRLDDILSHAELSQVIDSPASRLVSPCTRDALCIDEIARREAPAIPTGNCGSSAPAFVLCSSGSTGLPKMIVRNHESFMHRLNWTWQRHPFEPGEICCLKAQVTTTHSIYELFEPLLCGVTVLVIAESIVRDLEAFWRTIVEHGVSRLLMVPSALHASMQIPDFSAPAIRVLVVMGEYIDAKLAERLRAVFPATRIYSIYGSTEASSVLVCDLCGDWNPGEDVPLGEPIASSIELSVLDADLRPVSAGEVGQLYLSGPALFSKYLNDHDLTESALVGLSGRSEKWYDTNDAVRRMPGGSLQFIGRVDDTVKIRGFRVDLKEVEHALLALDAVNQATVVVDQCRAGSGSLLAFVTPSDVDPSRAMQVVKDRLPEYMMPSAIVSVDSFPITERGKLDKNKLVSEYRNRPSNHSEWNNASETEHRVLRVWAEVLGHSAFDVDMSFFEAGGTSLTVFSVVNLLRSEFSAEGLSLSVTTVYQFPTVRLLARQLARIMRGALVDDSGLSPLLVPLKQSKGSDQAPLFLIASAGG
ncbi:MAG: AMP-binding protein, partial [Pseudomonadota bacterium]